MVKTTFTGYVPSLKSKHEATIVGGKAIESKGGSIRYMLQGEYDGRKTLPKTVSKADFESVYGFDAEEAKSVFIAGLDKDGNRAGKVHVLGIKEKDDFIPERIMPLDGYVGGSMSLFENHADTVGEPSPANVEPPAPSEKPFPQEPTNENFSADNEAYYQELEIIDELETGGYDAGDLNDMIEELVIADGGEKEWLESYGYEDWSEVNLSKKDAIKVIVSLRMNQGYTVREGCYFCGQSSCENQETEDRSECENPDLDEGKYFWETKEAFGLFGDKEEEKEEEPKEQEFTVVLQEGDKLELTDIEETGSDDSDPKEDNNDSNEENEEKADDEDEEKEADFEAVQAKVTRPVKEEKEDEVKDDEEGSVDLGTIATVGAVGLTALALGSVFMGEDEEDDYWAGENAYWRAEGSGEIDHDRIDTYEQAEVHFRHDYPTTHYEWTTAKDDLTDEEEDMADSEVRWDIGSEPEEGEDWASIDVDGVGTVNYSKDTDYGEKRFYGLAAEDFQKMTSSEFVPFDQITAEIQEEWDETTPSIAADYEPSNEPTNANFSAETSTKQGWEITHYGNKGETRIAKKDGLSVYIEKIPKSSYQHKTRGSNWRVIYGRYVDDGSGGVIIPLAKLFSTYNDIFTWLNNPPHTIHNHAETVGSPSPSGPSSVPEPAEATGSEPSNEHMNADSNTMNWVLGLTAVGVGVAALGYSDKILAFFDRFKK